MYILDSPSSDPHFNIATEEYLLKETTGDFTFIYVNDPSIIIGKHQNAYAEVNLPYILDNDIPLVRRISGGGTVWHDPGNVNFSFILNGKEGQLVNFREYTTPVLDYLRELKIPAEFGKRFIKLVLKQVSHRYDFNPLSRVYYVDSGSCAASAAAYYAHADCAASPGFSQRRHARDRQGPLALEQLAGLRIGRPGAVQRVPAGVSEAAVCSLWCDLLRLL
jgi:hypothetical protein